MIVHCASGRSHAVRQRAAHDDSSEVVKRSVFAGIDQSPAFTASQDAMKEKMLKKLPGLALRRQLVRLEQTAVEHAQQADTSQHVTAEHAQQSNTSQQDTAEHVQPQTLDTRSGRANIVNPDMELDEMSVKASKLLFGTRELFRESRRQLDPSSDVTDDASVLTHDVGNKEWLDAAKNTACDTDAEISTHDSNQPSVSSSVSGQRQRTTSGPKTLTPAEAPPASLVVTCSEGGEEQEISGLGSPRLLPPTLPPLAASAACQAPPLTERESGAAVDDATRF